MFISLRAAGSRGLGNRGRSEFRVRHRGWSVVRVRYVKKGRAGMTDQETASPGAQNIIIIIIRTKYYPNKTELKNALFRTFLTTR